MKDVPAEAEVLHQQGRRAGAAGEYDKALALLQRASSLAPNWPYPVYDMAYTFLLIHDTANATRCYRKTVDWLPGDSSPLSPPSIPLSGSKEEIFRRAHIKHIYP